MDVSQDAVARHDGGRFSVSRQELAISSALVTVLACALVAILGWAPFGLFGSKIRSLLSPGTCVAFQTGTPAMYLCSAKIAGLTLLGPISLSAFWIAVFLALRKLIAEWIKKMPSAVRYVAAPVVATLFFTITWAGVHYGMAFRVGIVPQILFPVIIGLFSWVVARYDLLLHRRILSRPLFDFRDKLPRAMRIVIVILTPVALSFATGLQKHVGAPALKEQLVVVVTLAAAYLLLSAGPLRRAPITPGESVEGRR